MNDYYVLIMLCCLGLALAVITATYRHKLLSTVEWMTSFQSVTKKSDEFLNGSVIVFLSIIGMIFLMAENPGWPEGYVNHPTFYILAAGTVFAWFNVLSSFSFFYRASKLYSSR